MNKRFILNIVKLFASNILSLGSGVIVGFVVPKIMGMTDYANYKIYTLYLVYLSLLSLGFGDGIYLKYAGIDKEKFNSNDLRWCVRQYYKQLLILQFLCLAFVFIFIPSEYKIIGIFLSIALGSSNVVSLHQNFSLITSRFNEYSIRTIIKAGLTSVFVIILYIFYKSKNQEINYKIYILGILTIELVLAFWYFYSYKDINLGKIDRGLLKKKDYFSILSLGFPLLLSNMAGTIFLNLDRQFVSILFKKEDYAIYAFAYNMLSLVTTMTSAVSLVLFPSMKKNKDKSINNIGVYSSMFLIVVTYVLAVFFVLYYVVAIVLPKYVGSIEIFRIVLPGVILSSSISVIYINYYKLDNDVKLYLKLTLLTIAISAMLNFLAFNIFGTYQSISWASIVSLILWYLLISAAFNRKHKIKNYRNIIYLVSVSFCFYIITGIIKQYWLGLIIYILAVSVITFWVQKDVVFYMKKNICR